MGMSHSERLEFDELRQRLEAIESRMAQIENPPADPVVLADLKVTQLREILKGRGVTVPFGASRETVLQLLEQSEPKEAA